MEGPKHSVRWLVAAIGFLQVNAGQGYLNNCNSARKKAYGQHLRRGNKKARPCAKIEETTEC